MKKKKRENKKIKGIFPSLPPYMFALLCSACAHYAIQSGSLSSPPPLSVHLIIANKPASPLLDYLSRPLPRRQYCITCPPPPPHQSIKKSSIDTSGVGIGLHAFLSRRHRKQKKGYRESNFPSRSPFHLYDGGASVSAAASIDGVALLVCGEVVSDGGSRAVLSSVPSFSSAARALERCDVSMWLFKRSWDDLT